MAESPRKPRRRGRIVLISLGAMLLVIVLLVALTPMIAGRFIPATAERNLNQQIQGHATVGRASLSWWGPQRLGPIEIVDIDGRPVANIEIETSRGLFGLLGVVTGASPMNLGTTTVTGQVVVIRRPDGTIHLQDVFQPTPPDETRRETYLPETLTGRFVLDGVMVTYIDEVQRLQGSPTAVVRIPAFQGEASITNATRAEASLAGVFFYGPSVAGATSPGGQLEIVARADDLTEPDGRLVLDQATFNVQFEADQIAMPMADALAQMDGQLVQALGQQLQVQATARGTLADGRFYFAAVSPGMNANLQFATVDGILRTPEPGSIELQSGSALTLIPGFTEAIAAQEDVTFDQLPGATITIDDVNIPLPIGERPLDLRGGSFNLAVRTGETVGRVRTPAAPPIAGAPPVAGEIQEYRLAPIQAQVRSRDLADRITIRARTQAMLGGESAGTLEVDLAAIDPLDARGHPRPTLARDLNGVASLTGFATIILQPFVEGMGIQMVQDVGPELDFVLRATARTDAAEPTPGEEPDPATRLPTELSLQMNAANITAQAGFLLDQNILTSDERGVEMRIGTLAPMMTRMFAEQGLAVDSGAGVQISARDVRIDMTRLFAEDIEPRSPAETAAPGADLRAVAGLFRLETTPATGRLVLIDPQDPGAPPVRHQWELAPGEAIIDAADLQRGVRIQARTSARLDGEPAGNFEADVRITELLDAEGRPREGLPAIDGRASLSQIATAILQPFVEEAGLDLYRGAGPQINLVLTASSEAAPAADPGAAPGATLPRSLIDLTIRSQGINGDIPLMVDGRALRTRNNGARISVQNPGVLLGPAARDAGVVLTEGGFLGLTARDLVVALDHEGEPLLDRSAGEIEIAMGAFGLLPALPPAPPAAPAPGQAQLPPPPSPILLEQLALRLRFAPQRTPVLTLQGTGRHQNASFSTQGSLQLVGLDGAMDPGAIRPVGDIVLRNIPSALITLVMQPDPQAALDPVRLAQELIGPAANITITAAQVPEGDPLDRRLTLTARSQGATAQASGLITRGAFQMRQFDASATVAPALASTLIGAFVGEQLEAPPRIAQPARLVLAVQPFAIPMIGGMPDMTAAGDTSVTLGLEGQLIVTDIVLAGTPEAPPRPIGALGLQDVNLRIDLPLAALAAETAAPARFNARAVVLGAPGQPMMEMQSQGRAMVAGGRPVDAMTADFQIQVRDAVRLDEILGQDGMFFQAVGQTLAVQASANVDFPPATMAPAQPPGALPPGAGPGAAEPGAFAFNRARLQATITAPRLTTPQPIRLTILPDRMQLDEGATLQWQMHHNWANRFLLGIMPGVEPTPQEARFTQPTPMRIGLIALRTARGETVGPMAPDRFNLNIHITSPGSEMLIGGVTTRVSGLNTQIMRGQQPGSVGFSLRLQDAGGGPGPQGEPAVHFAGGVYNLADPLGNLTTETAVITMQGNARNIPTAIIDGLTQQDGLLVQGLGPTVTMNLNMRGFSADGGDLTATAVSERANARISGTMRQGRFIADDTAQVTLSIITPDFGARLTQGLPLVGSLEKTTAEEPATVSITSLVLPLDGDLRGLNGRITFDPGEARFGVSPSFTPVLRFIDEPREAIIGRRLQPISLTVNEGVMRYDRFDIPIGEFIFGMQGTADLVNRRLDVITFVPFGAVAEDVIGGVTAQITRLPGVGPQAAQAITTVPFRARGEFGRFSVQPDLELLTRELQRQLLSPDRIIGGTARDVLDRLIPGRNGNGNNNQQPPPPQQQPGPQQPAPQQPGPQQPGPQQPGPQPPAPQQPQQQPGPQPPPRR